jgi:thiamine biosynthesis lipoprotein
MPSENSRSISIITTDPALADLYSTAIFNMSVEDGQTFVNGIDGIEAIWFGIDGTVYFSENFEEEYLVDLY